MLLQLRPIQLQLVLHGTPLICKTSFCSKIIFYKICIIIYCTAKSSLQIVLRSKCNDLHKKIQSFHNIALVFIEKKLCNLCRILFLQHALENCCAKLSARNRKEKYHCMETLYPTHFLNQCYGKEITTSSQFIVHISAISPLLQV